MYNAASTQIVSPKLIKLYAVKNQIGEYREGRYFLIRSFWKKCVNKLFLKPEYRENVYWKGELRYLYYDTMFTSVDVQSNMYTHWNMLAAIFE